jgi:hypothetical protein
MSEGKIIAVRWAILAFCILFWVGVFFAIKAVLS